jgi:hypothetical protein
MSWLSNWNELKNLHQTTYEHCANGPPPPPTLLCRTVGSSKSVTSCTQEKLRYDTPCMSYKLSESTCWKKLSPYDISHSHQFTSSFGQPKLIWPPCYLTCTIRMAHIKTQDVEKSENTVANFKIGGCETLRLYIKIFMYMQVGRLSGCNLKRPLKLT